MYVASKEERWKGVGGWAMIENFLSFYSRVHDGFCKRCCAIAEYEVSFNNEELTL